MKLRNKNILIFGGGSGIGKAIAARFVKAGAKVMIAGRSVEKLKKAAEEINSENLFFKDIIFFKNSDGIFRARRYTHAFSSGFFFCIMLIAFN